MEVQKTTREDITTWRPGAEPSNDQEVEELLDCILRAAGGIPIKPGVVVSPEERSYATSLKYTAIDGVKFVAESIYSSGERLVYELIQNADDNHYTKLVGSSRSPELTIKLSKEKLVIETNEDGFTRADVESISSYNKSTKAQTLDKAQTGEKGVGFKSVFSAAGNVLIQSGMYSFSFSYDRDDEDGAWGMLVPLKQSPRDMPHYGTRITLTKFHGIGYDGLRKELDSLPDELLLFLRQLCTIRLHLDDGETLQQTTWAKHETNTPGFVEIHVSTEVSSKEDIDAHTSSKDQKHKYYLQTKLFSDLPEDRNRQVKTTKQYITTAQVVVAFPLDENNLPLIANQFAYAFLPMGRFGFSFIIQSDFVTQASRQDVLHSSVRNIALLSRVAEVYCDAIEVFCKRKDLRYSWMRYLPQGSILSEFWQPLTKQLYHELRSRKVLEPYNLQSWLSLHTPVSLHIVPSTFLDKNSVPLLRSTSWTQYLSLEYSVDDRAKLEAIGTSELESGRILSLLEVDLNLQNSLWKDLSQDADWQARTSRVLSDICGESSYLEEELCCISLIRLKTGLWTNALETCPVYFPAQGETSIPDDLGFNLVDPESILVDKRRHLMEMLGVTHAPSEDVIKQILFKHEWNKGIPSIETGVAHLVYLFRHGCQEKDLAFFCDKGSTWKASSTVFLPQSREMLGPQQLFRKIENTAIRAPGYAAHLLHPLYLTAVDDDAINDQSQSWTTWLSNVAGILKAPRLSITVFVRRSSELRIAPEFKYLLDYRPDIVVALLHKHQRSWEKQMQYFRTDIKNSKVMCADGASVPLHESILPSTKLRKLADNFGLEDLPFISLDAAVSDAQLHGYNFLANFGTIITENLDFYIKCLDAIDPVSKGNAVDAVFQIYTKLEDLCTQADRGRLRKHLADRNWIYIPPSAASQHRMISSLLCRWDGPSWLTCRFVLHEIAQYRSLHTLMCTIVHIEDADWKDAEEELLHMKRNSSRDLEKAKTIYQVLWQEFSGDKTGTTLRDMFRKTAMILTPQGNWLLSTECVWAPKKVKVDGKTSIKEFYDSVLPLKDMFLKGLKIPEPDLEMHIASLESLAKNQAPITTIFDVMTHIADLKLQEDALIKALQNVNIFPVRGRNGESSRTTLGVDFLILDNETYRKHFESLVRVLDFSHAEVWRILDFLIACGLRNRLVSESVTESTSASDATHSLQLTNDIRSRAYALLRYAKHFKSPKTIESHVALYDDLRGINIFVSNNITKSLSVFQYGQEYSVPTDQSDLHFDTKGPLNIYVPADSRKYKRCWPRDVIPKLKSWLGISDSHGDDILLQIFHRDDLELLDEDLERRGIIAVPGVVRDVSLEHPTQVFRSNDQHTPRRENQLEVDHTRTSTSYTTTPVRGASVAVGRDLSATVNSSDSSTSPRPFAFPVQPAEPLDNHVHADGYRDILDKIIRAARSRAFPKHREAAPPSPLFKDSNRLRGAFGPTILNGSRNIHRDHRVGAAGELYVFELLKKLELPNFGMENWPSLIRNEVKVHEDYADILTWTGRETSDLVYNDASGSLTKILCDTKHLDSGTWYDERPQYLIEVKTTTEVCEEAFFVSAAQYDLMLRMHTPTTPSLFPRSFIYLVARVFNIGQGDSIGIRLFLDPIRAKEAGELEFVTHTWNVKVNSLANPM